jgi:hypothetical protein
LWQDTPAQSSAVHPLQLPDPRCIHEDSYEILAITRVRGTRTNHRTRTFCEDLGFHGVSIGDHLVTTQAQIDQYHYTDDGNIL